MSGTLIFRHLCRFEAGGSCWDSWHGPNTRALSDGARLATKELWG
jgi:hypothetical protein